MAAIIFKRTSNDFSDILKEKCIRQKIRTKIFWPDHMIIVLSSHAASEISFIKLKYLSDILPRLSPDRTPIEGIDYA